MRTAEGIHPYDLDPADPDGYYATGSELFVLDSWWGVGFLNHGGHLWDHAYSLTNLALTTVNYAPGDYNTDGVVDAEDQAAFIAAYCTDCADCDTDCDLCQDALSLCVTR